MLCVPFNYVKNWSLELKLPPQGDQSRKSKNQDSHIGPVLVGTPEQSWQITNSTHLSFHLASQCSKSKSPSLSFVSAQRENWASVCSSSTKNPPHRFLDPQCLFHGRRFLFYDEKHVESSWAPHFWICRGNASLAEMGVSTSLCAVSPASWEPTPLGAPSGPGPPTPSGSF